MVLRLAMISCHFSSSLSALRSALTINLMNEILSREHYINIAARLDHPSDAESLVDLIYHFLHHYSLSNQDLDIVDVKRRARRFMLAVISTMHGLALSNIPYDPDSYVFPLLLSILNNKPKSPITSILNKMTINLMTEILSKEGHVALIAQVDQASDAKNLLDFIPHILHYHSNHGSATIEMNRRAKQLMLGVIEKMRGFNVPSPNHQSR
ncbi:hypothetical protein F5887DRAFT_53298 [Amanita rubescens]|nr:hypothetical protein F5887DRAFT_53298 [Amanita rubescens]